jgi:hypothetical protein
MLRRVVGLVTVLVVVLSLNVGTASAAPGSNKEAAKFCQQGGWATLAPGEPPTVPFPARTRAPATAPRAAPANPFLLAARSQSRSSPSRSLPWTVVSEWMSLGSRPAPMTH